MVIKFFTAFFGKTVSREEFRFPKSREQTVLFHWKIIVTTFFVMMLLIFATSLLIYRDIGRGEFFSVEKVVASGSSPAALKRLGSVVDNFEKKITTFEQVRKNRVSSVDPSR